MKQNQRYNTYKDSILLPAKRDLVFKAIFISGGDFELLASFLSSILDMDLATEDITILNSELSPAYESGKLSRVDIRAKTKDGSHIDVEIQLQDRKDIEKRSLYYLSRLYMDQMGKGTHFKDICPAIAINILDYNFLPFAEYHNRYRMHHIGSGHELTDVFEINFIELRKVPAEKTKNLKELWMQYLSADKMEVLEMLKEQNPILEKAVDKLVYVSADEILRYELFLREKDELDYWSDMATSREEGLEQGREEVCLKIVKALIAKDVPKETILDATGLSEDAFNNLAKEL